MVFVFVTLFLCWSNEKCIFNCVNLFTMKEITRNVIMLWYEMTSRTHFTMGRCFDISGNRYTEICLFHGLMHTFKATWQFNRFCCFVYVFSLFVSYRCVALIKCLCKLFAVLHILWLFSIYFICNIKKVCVFGSKIYLVLWHAWIDSIAISFG